MLQSSCISLLKSSIAEKRHGLCKSKKIRRRVRKIDTKVSKILKTMSTKMPTIKKRGKEIALVLLQMYFKFQQERYVARRIVELC